MAVYLKLELKPLMTINFTHTIYLNSWRGFGGFEGDTSKWDYKAWKGLKKYFSNREYNTDNEGVVTVIVNWDSPIKHAKIADNLYRKTSEEISTYWNSESSNEALEKIYCDAVALNEKDEPAKGSMDYIRYYLYECFLIMNLSSPGSFNLYLSSIKRNTPSSYPTLDEEVLSCSEYLFENALHDSLNNSWPEIAYIDIRKVVSWYQKHNIGLTQVANTRIEKALFSLLHIAKHTSPQDTLMWHAYCLESLYDTPNALSYNFLVQRAYEFLDIPERHKKGFAKSIRAFYDKRNAFAHGNSKIIHPIEHEGWDKSVDEYRYKLQNICDFSSLVIVASLQQYIRKGLREVQFIEKSQNIKI